MALWARIPVIVRAVLSGIALAAIVTVPWGVMATANIRYLPRVPWAVPLTAALVWLWWQWVSGKGWPRRTAQARRDSLRARSIPEDLWGTAIVAGILGIVTSLLILRVTRPFASLPEQAVPQDLSQLPVVTLLLLNLTGAAVAGIVEEASFRGYMQRPIERRHGAVIAIAVSSLLFGLAHFTHQGFLTLMPFYVAIGATYGTMAYLTNSILPGMILHAAGDAMGGFMVLASGRQVSSQPIPVPAGGSGFDAAFWISCVALVGVGAATVWVFAGLAREAGLHISSSVPETSI